MGSEASFLNLTGISFHFLSGESSVRWDSSPFDPSVQKDGMLPCHSTPKDSFPSLRPW